MAIRLFPARGERKTTPAPHSPTERLITAFSASGIAYTAESGREDWLDYPFRMREDQELTSFLAQLEEQAIAQMVGSELRLTWQQVYRIKTSRDYAMSYLLLKLPASSVLRPCLASSGSFCDSDFSIFVSGWKDDNGLPVMEDPRITGAIIETGCPSERQSALLKKHTWLTLKAISAFHQRTTKSRTRESNMNCWAVIRRHAIEAQAELADYLKSTVVVTPEKIAIQLRKHSVGGCAVVEVIPSFEGQPPNWLQTFDQFSSVRECYEVPHGAAITYVDLSPEVQTVLKEIKRMPARRVAGDRGKAFLRNPFASLGPNAEKVIDGKQFEEERIRAGISFTRFLAYVHHDGQTGNTMVCLRIEEEGSDSKFFIFKAREDLEAFIKTVEIGIRKGAQSFPWRGRELEILGDTPDQIATLRRALEHLHTPIESKASDVFDPALYSDRIAGFGVETAYPSPFIARATQSQGWLPQNVGFCLQYAPDASDQPITVLLKDENLRELEGALQSAKSELRAEFTVSFLPKPLLVAQTEALLNISRGQEQGQQAAQKLAQDNDVKGSAPMTRRGLIVKPNVIDLDYEEPCAVPSFDPNSQPLLPAKLREGVSLKDHQLVGIAWLQHLWNYSPGACRGALLADDMGLGKTIQLLAFIAHCLERDPQLDPVLIVAPLTLLENWQDEIEKFFEPHTFPCLRLYGNALRQRRAPQSQIEDDLAGAGVARLLIGQWLGEAKVVLTTYESLRDLEFSLARQKWSIMVCDEAQKIKTPGAMTTRAAKKQNTRFKVACTGTPVENTLADLWCLFDFIQPGLLGSLQGFGGRFARPIEAATHEEKIRVAELRRRIEPQTLRRTKSEVAKDLPPKISDIACREIAISGIQRAWYANTISKFNNRTKDQIQSQLNLLQYLRAVCSDPRPPAPEPATGETLADLENNSPKLRWMLTELFRIKARDEKVIIFTEVKELQRTLQRCIVERTGFTADIINGDSNAAAETTDSRHRRIRRFQEAPGFGVIILSPLALGVGLNIQGANHVIHYTRMWNPAREDQATDRAYRIGQTRAVFVYCPLVVAHDFITFDAKLHELLELKRKLSQDMLNGSGDLRPSDFSALQNPSGSLVFAVEAAVTSSHGQSINSLSNPPASLVCEDA